MPNVHAAFRSLRRELSLTVFLMALIAFTIGSVATAISLIQTVLLRELPVKDPQTVVFLGTDSGTYGGNFGQTGAWSVYSYPLYQYFRTNAKTVVELSAVQSFTTRVSVATAREQGRQQSSLVKLVSDNYFDVMEATPYLGVCLFKRTAAPTVNPEAIISFHAWEMLFGSDPKVIGKDLRINHMLVTVAAVMRPEFAGERLEAETPDVWLPLSFQREVMQQWYLDDQEMHWLNIVGRIRREEDRDKASVELTTLLRRFIRGQAGTSLSAEEAKKVQLDHVTVIPGGNGVSSVADRFSKPLWILLIVVSLAFLATVANVATLFLMRARVRERDIIVTLALGGSRWGILRQALVESAVLSSTGSLLGVVGAYWTTRSIIYCLWVAGRMMNYDSRPNVTTIVILIGLAVFGAIVIALVPTVQLLNVDIGAALRGQRPVIHRSRVLRTGPLEILMAAQVGLCVSLTIIGLPMIRQYLILKHTGLGYEPNHVLAIKVDEHVGVANPARLKVINEDLRERVAAVPGVVSASLAKTGLLAPDVTSGNIAIDGYVARVNDNMVVQVNFVSPDYFRTEGMEIVLGRAFERKDLQAPLPVAVVNETLVKRFFVGRNPIGKGIKFTQRAVIVGVVKDAKYNSLKAVTPPMLFLNLDGFRASELDVRTVGDPEQYARAVREVIATSLGGFPVIDVATLAKRVDNSILENSLGGILAISYALFSFVLVCLSVIGVVGLSLTSRYKELGIRLTVGASPSRLLGMLLGQNMIVVLGGVILGSIVAVVVEGSLSRFLYEPEATEMSDVLTVALLMVIVSGLTVLVRSRRTVTDHPIIFLRSE